MKSLAIAFGLVAFVAAPSFAQERAALDPSGYVSAFGGPVWSAGNSSGSVLFEGGVRLAPHVMVFGDVGRFSNLKADLQPTLNQTTTALANQGLTVSGGGTLPAWYGLGGLRAEVPVGSRAIPYVLGGVGGAHMDPSTLLLYSSGTMPDGSTPAAGTDVTSALVSNGNYVTPAASTAFMFTLGGGVQMPIVGRWAGDIGYRYSRIATDSTLSASPLNTSVMTFGFGYRF